MANIGPHTTSRGGGNLAWAGSRHGIAEAHPGTLNASAFDAAPGVEDGVVPSGYPLTERSDDTYGPYDGTTLSGFSIGDREVSLGDCPTAVLWHGRIIVDELPVDDFAYPAGTAFTFEGGTAVEGGAA